jgi:hypothetical protein
MVGHIDDGAGGGVERAVVSIAAAVHLRGNTPRKRKQEHRQG